MTAASHHAAAMRVIDRAKAIGIAVTHPKRGGVPTSQRPRTSYRDPVPLPQTAEHLRDAIRRLPCRYLGDQEHPGTKVRICLYEGHDIDRCLPSGCGVCRKNTVFLCARCDHHLPEDFIPSRSMSLDAVTEWFLSGKPFPEAFTSWPVIRRWAIERQQAFVAPPKPSLNGRAIVSCGGGKYEPGLYVLARMLHHLGSPYPLVIYHRPNEKVGAKLRAIADVREYPPCRRMTGWEGKSLAITSCGYREILWFDADAYPVVHPDVLFDDNPKGVVVFPDIKSRDLHLPSYGLKELTVPKINGGQYVIDLDRAWDVLSLHRHFDEFSDFYYRRPQSETGGYGDQDQMRAALAVTGGGYTMYNPNFDRPQGVWIYRNEVQPVIVHRIGAKFGIKDIVAPAPLEELAWRFYREW